MKSVVLLKSGAARRGGLEKWARLLASAFLERGCEVTLLTTGERPSLSEDIQVVSMPRSYPMSFLQVKAFDRFCMEFLKKNRADVVFGLDRNSFQTHLRAGNGVHLCYLQKRKEEEGRLASLKHTLNPLHRTLLSLERKAFEHPQLERLITNSHMVKNEVLTHFAVDPQKIEVVHNGVEWHAYTEAFEEWPKKHIRKSHFELLFVGHGFRRKGLERLLKGLHTLDRNKEIHLSVVGKDKELNFFKQLSLRLGVNATFHGPQSDITSIYQQADALAIPSFYDPFANVTVEALAFGLFVVSSKHNGGSEILTPENGAIIEDLSSDISIAKALEIALKSPKTLKSSERIRTAARSFDLSNQLARFMEICLT